MSEFIPAALTIAGSDSGGGAGIQADLRAFRSFGVFGCSAITAVTSQNPTGVRRIDALPPEAVTAQLGAVLDAFAIRAVKTGMLFSVELVHAVHATLQHVTVPVVVDPVMVATSGSKLLREDAIEAVVQKILPLADWITPNLPEAELLLGRSIPNFDSAAQAALELARRFHCNVILKGGHALQDSAARDAVCMNSQLYVLSAPRIETLPHASHGTGCSLSSALAAALASGMSPVNALTQAKAFIGESLRLAVPASPDGKPKIAVMPPNLSAPFPAKDVHLEVLP